MYYFPDIILSTFTHINSVNVTPVILCGWCYYYPHFTGKETGAQSHNKGGLPDTPAPEANFKPLCYLAFPRAIQPKGPASKAFWIHAT